MTEPRTVSDELGSAVDEVGTDDVSFVGEGVSLGIQAEVVENGTGDDSAESEFVGASAGDGDGATGDGVREPDGGGQGVASEVVFYPDEATLREFDYEARYAIAYAGLGFCGGAVLGSVFSRGWQRWGEGTVTKGE